MMLSFLACRGWSLGELAKITACGANQALGTLDIRRRFTNNTGARFTRLRFRIMDICLFKASRGVRRHQRTGLAIAADFDECHDREVESEHNQRSRGDRIN